MIVFTASLTIDVNFFACMNHMMVHMLEPWFKHGLNHKIFMMYKKSEAEKQKNIYNSLLTAHFPCKLSFGFSVGG